MMVRPSAGFEPAFPSVELPGVAPGSAACRAAKRPIAQPPQRQARPGVQLRSRASSWTRRESHPDLVDANDECSLLHEPNCRCPTPLDERAARARPGCEAPDFRRRTWKESNPLPRCWKPRCALRSGPGTRATVIWRTRSAMTCGAQGHVARERLVRGSHPSHAVDSGAATLVASRGIR